MLGSETLGVRRYAKCYGHAGKRAFVFALRHWPIEVLLAVVGFCATMFSGEQGELADATETAFLTVAIAFVGFFLWGIVRVPVEIMEERRREREDQAKRIEELEAVNRARQDRRGQAEETLERVEEEFAALGRSLPPSLDRVSLWTAHFNGLFEDATASLEVLYGRGAATLFRNHVNSVYGQVHDEFGDGDTVHSICTPILQAVNDALSEIRAFRE